MTRDLDGWTIAFDLDGTLIDTAPDLMATANAILEKNGYMPGTEDVLRPVISFGSRAMLQTAIEAQTVTASTFGVGGSAVMPPPDLDGMFADFLSYYRTHIADHSRPFDGAAAVLSDIRARGGKSVVCTNKLEEPTRALFDALALTDQFDFIAGRDTFPVHKPDPGHLIRAIEGGGGDPSRAVMVGDSDVDVMTAKAAGIPVIGVTFGYTPVPVTELGCDAVIDNYAGFFGALTQLIAASTRS